jgi:hypothetical protein
LYRRLSGLQNQSGSGGEEKDSQPLSRFELPTIQPVAQRYTTELWFYNDRNRYNCESRKKAKIGITRDLSEESLDHLHLQESSFLHKCCKR